VRRWADNFAWRRGGGYLTIDPSVIPTSGPFTLEFFATHKKVINYSRIFSLGKGDNMSVGVAEYSEILFMSWTHQGKLERDEVRLVCGTTPTAEIDRLNELQPYTVDVPWHVVMACTPLANGRMRIVCVKEALDGSGRRSFEDTTGDAWSIPVMNPDSLYLGHSRWAQDADANASYDEVRIWNTALSYDQMKLSALLGPDRLPTASEAGAIQQTVTVKATEAGQVQISEGEAAATASVTVAGDELVTLTATPNPGCRFIHWTGDVGSIVVGNEEVTTVTVVAARAPTLTAVFEPVALVWCGAGVEGGNWSEAANWVDPANPFPVFNYGAVTFTGDERTINTNDYVSALKSLTIDHQAGAFTLAGNEIDVPVIENNSEAPQRLELPLNVSGDRLTITNNGALAFAGNVKTSGFKMHGTNGNWYFGTNTVEVRWLDIESPGANVVFDRATVSFVDNFYGAFSIPAGTAQTGSMTDSTVTTGTFCSDTSAGTGNTKTVPGGNGFWTQTRGSFTVGNYLIIGRDHVGTYDLVDGTMNATGSLGVDRFFIGEVVGSDGTLNIRGDSTLTCMPNLQVGRYGTGTLNLLGGSLTMDKAWFSVARMAGSCGTVNVTGGTLTGGNGVIIGEQGWGKLNISGAGVVNAGGTLRMGQSATASAQMNITDGGRLRAPNIQRSNEECASQLYVDGGTIEAVGTGATLNDFLNVSCFNVGPQGATLDTGDNTVVINRSLGSEGSAGTLRKIGSGTLAVPASEMGKVKVEEGTLAATATAAASAKLLHRWSFNGNLDDSVGGSTATSYGTTTVTGEALSLPGGANGTGYVDLGAGLIPTSGPFTIEIFATQVGVKNWGRILSFGNGTGTENMFFMSWSRGTTVGNDRVALADSYSASAAFSFDEKLQPYTTGVKWHIAASFIPNFCGDGRMKVLLVKEALDGSLRRTFTHVTTNPYSFERMNQNTFYLGHSRWGGDNDAQAEYDEVRIWDSALSVEQLTANAGLGPNTLPTAAEEAGSPLTEEQLLHRWSFNGDLEDSVGGTSATLVGGATRSMHDVTSIGGGNGKGYINLGNNMLPADGGDITLEIWAKENSVQKWGRVFDIGANQDNYLTLAWAQGTDVNTDRLEIKRSNIALLQANTTLFGYTLGMQYHIALTIQQQPDGKALLRWVRRNASTGAIIKSGSGTTSSAWSVANIAGGPFYLGHSQYGGDSDAAATYDEVRVWRGVMPDRQLELSARRGPDRLPTGSLDTTTRVELTPGTRLTSPGMAAVDELSGTGSIEGAIEVAQKLDIAGESVGTMALAGTLKISGEWVVDGDNRACDFIDGAETGSLDLAGVTVRVRNATAVKGPYLLAEVKSVTGLGTSHVAHKGYRLAFDETTGKLTLTTDALFLIIR